MSDHKHHAVSLAAFIGLGILLGIFAGCATLKTCARPVEAQAIQDAAGVLVCNLTQGKTLADCEAAQLAVEAGQLSQDALMCGEQAIAAASSGTHAGK